MGPGPEKSPMAEWRKGSRTLTLLRMVDVSGSVAMASEKQAPSRREEGRTRKSRTAWVQRGRKCIWCRQAGNRGEAPWRRVVRADPRDLDRQK